MGRGYAICGWGVAPGDDGVGVVRVGEEDERGEIDGEGLACASSSSAAVPLLCTSIRGDNERSSLVAISNLGLLLSLKQSFFFLVPTLKSSGCSD